MRLLFSHAALFAVLLASGCGSPCGPSSGMVDTIVDGDTISLVSGEKVRYLLADTPEITSGKHECYGAEARDMNQSLVQGQRVDLKYDQQCLDRYGRLLAYVWAGGREVNTRLVEEGYACVLYIPPDGQSRKDEFLKLQQTARDQGKGLWSCTVLPSCAQ